MMSSQDNVPKVVPTTSAVTDTAQMHEVIGVVKATLGTIEQQFKTISEQSARISSFGPNLEHASAEIDGLRRQIKKQDKDQQTQLQQVRDLVNTQLHDQVEKKLESHIQAEIRRDLSEEIRAQVASQLKEHLPISLEDQLSETKDQVLQVERAVSNSEARRMNACLRADNIHDPLQVVYTPAGTKSDLYPHNLNSLLAYDDEKLRHLLRDHDLLPQQEKEANLNRFMAHIGAIVRFVPGDGEATPH